MEENILNILLMDNIFFQINYQIASTSSMHKPFMYNQMGDKELILRRFITSNEIHANNPELVEIVRILLKNTNLTYARMISVAILSTRDRMSKLQEIYNFISYYFYEIINKNKTSWKVNILLIFRIKITLFIGRWRPLNITIIIISTIFIIFLVIFGRILILPVFLLIIVIINIIGIVVLLFCLIPTDIIGGVIGVGGVTGIVIILGPIVFLVVNENE